MDYCIIVQNALHLYPCNEYSTHPTNFWGVTHMVGGLVIDWSLKKSLNYIFLWLYFETMCFLRPSEDIDIDFLWLGSQACRVIYSWTYVSVFWDI